MLEALLLALALAMDAFAVALTQGARCRPGWRAGAAIAITFGLFQAVMPLIGWGVGAFGLAYLEAVDHWIAFGLLTVIGLHMIVTPAPQETVRRLRGAALLMAGLATSIDALAAGVTLPTLAVAPHTAAALIGLVTLLMSGAGIMLGRVAGDRWGIWAERAGGVILIGLGCKILAEHNGLL